MRDSAEMICGKQEKCAAVDFKMGIRLRIK
ncbi:hypothetical protein OGM84_06340 [Pediococcus acidilactici]